MVVINEELINQILFITYYRYIVYYLDFIALQVKKKKNDIYVI